MSIIQVNILIPYPCIVSNPPCQFMSLDGCPSKSRNSQAWKLQALDSFLSWQSHQSQDSTNFFYHLNIETIQKLTGDSNHDKTLVKNWLDSNTQWIKHAPVTFLISLGQNVYYLTLFDFAENKALILGHCGPVTVDIVTVHLKWEAWDGPTLWKRIGQAFNWMDETWPMPVIYEANWIPVYVYIISL